MELARKGRRHVKLSKLFLGALSHRWLNIFVGIAWSQIFWLLLEGVLGNADTHAPIRLSSVFAYAVSLQSASNLLLYFYRESEALGFLCELSTDVVGFAWVNVADELLSQMFGVTALTAATYVVLVTIIGLTAMVAGAASREWLSWPLSFEGTANEFAAGSFAIPTSWLITQTVHIGLYGFFYRSSYRSPPFTQGGEDGDDVIHLSSSLLLLPYAFLCTLVATRFFTGTVDGSSNMLLHREVKTPLSAIALAEGDDEDMIKGPRSGDSKAEGRPSNGVGDILVEHWGTECEQTIASSSSLSPQDVYDRTFQLDHSTRGNCITRFGGISRAMLLYGQLTVGMMVGWAYNMWGQVEFRQEELEFRYGPVIGAFIYAMLCTVLGTCVMIRGADGLDRTAPTQYDASPNPGVRFYRRRMLVAVGGVSLMVGWAWEETFDLFLDAFFGEDVGLGIILSKLGLAVTATACALGRNGRSQGNVEATGVNPSPHLSSGREGDLLTPLLNTECGE
ncbi:unnamed protein product [Choristocarpus tenellus]